MNNTLSVLAATCGIVLLGGFQNLPPAELPVALCQVTQSFDRESCEADCRLTFGVDLYDSQIRGGRGEKAGPWGTGSYYAYAR